MYILIASPDIPVSYTGKIFSEIVLWRDEATTNPISCLARRIISQIAFTGLCITGFVELLTYAFYHFATQQTNNDERMVNAGEAWILSVHCMLQNLFVRKVSLVFQTKYAEIFTHKSLWLAVSRGYYTMAEIALKQYRDPCAKEMMALITVMQRLCGQKQTQKLFPLNSYAKRYIESKLLSHWLELKGEVEFERDKVRLEGGPSQGGMCQSMVDSLKAFQKCEGFSNISLGAEKTQILQEAFSVAYNLYLNAKIGKDLQGKKLFFINTRWENHAICLVFFRDYMCIANGGPGADLHSTLKIYRIDRSRLNQAVFWEIWTHTSSKEKSGIDYFYNKLPTKLGAKTDALHDLFQPIAPPLAISGNCTLSSMQIALRFAWAMLLNPSPTPETLRQAQLESDLFLNWAAVRYVETLQPKKEFQDPAFLSQIAASEQQKNRNFVKTFHLLHAIATKKFSFLSSLWQKDYTLLRPLTACYYHCVAKPFAWRHFSHFSPEESLLEN